MATRVSKEQAQTIARLNRNEGRLKLAKHLKWTPFDEDDEPQLSIRLDYLYDSLMHMVEKGFSWHAIAVLFNVSSQLLEESLSKPLTEAIKTFNKLLHSVGGKVNEASLRQYSEYVFSTYMCHYKLYQYVFNNDQELLGIKMELPVETPTDAAPFTQAIDVDVYEYEKLYKQIESREKETHEERNKINEDTKMKDLECYQKTMQNANQAEPPLDREKITAIIQDVANAHMSSVSHALQQSIDSTMQDLKFMLEKTALPRPAALGPPPRFKLNSPIASAKIPAVEKVSKSRQSTRGSKK